MSKLQVGRVYGAASIGKRDAVHVAVIMATCHKEIAPGTWVRLDGHNAHPCMIGDPRHGVADPFIPEPIIAPGRPFLVLLNPLFVSDVTHTFQFPTEDRHFVGDDKDRHFVGDDEDRHFVGDDKDCYRDCSR